MAELARRQHGLVRRSQLAALGIGGRAIDSRLRAGRLHRIYQGVYAVGHPNLTLEGHFLSAVFACGERAVLSHQSAAVLWRLRPAKGPRVDVTVSSGGTRARRGAVIVHRSPLPPSIGRCALRSR